MLHWQPAKRRYSCARIGTPLLRRRTFGKITNCFAATGIGDGHTCEAGTFHDGLRDRALTGLGLQDGNSDACNLRATINSESPNISSVSQRTPPSGSSL